MHRMKRVEPRKTSVETYEETKNMTKTVKFGGTSRRIVRKWVRRYEKRGDVG